MNYLFEKVHRKSADLLFIALFREICPIVVVGLCGSRGSVPLSLLAAIRLSRRLSCQPRWLVGVLYGLPSCFLEGRPFSLARGVHALFVRPCSRYSDLPVVKTKISLSQGRLLGGAMGGVTRPRSAHHREVHRSGASEKWAIGWKARLASLLLTHVGGSGWGLEWLQEPKWLERTIAITKILRVNKKACNRSCRLKTW